MVSAESGIPFRIASFAPRSRVLSAASIGRDVEAGIVDEWTRVVRRDTDRILCSIDELDIRPGETEVAIGTGPSWAAALTSIGWEDPEVMMLGSSGLGTLKRVSLGDHATRILQNSPVPVVVVPPTRESAVHVPGTGGRGGVDGGDRRDLTLLNEPFQSSNGSVRTAQ